MNILLIFKQFLATLIVWTITFLIIKKHEHEKLRKTTYMVFYFLLDFNRFLWYNKYMK